MGAPDNITPGRTWADDCYILLGEMGYKGSVSDRMYAHMQDDAGVSSHKLSRADLMRIAGEKIDWLLTYEDAEGPSGPPVDPEFWGPPAIFDHSGTLAASAAPGTVNKSITVDVPVSMMAVIFIGGVHGNAAAFPSNVTVSGAPMLREVDPGGNHSTYLGAFVQANPNFATDTTVVFNVSTGTSIYFDLGFSVYLVEAGSGIAYKANDWTSEQRDAGLDGPVFCPVDTASYPVTYIGGLATRSSVPGVDLGVTPDPEFYEDTELVHGYGSLQTQSRQVDAAPVSEEPWTDLNESPTGIVTTYSALILEFSRRP